MTKRSGDDASRGSNAYSPDGPSVVFTDVHCHCLPGLDDGPANGMETLALCGSLVTDGVHQVVATPHQLGRFEGRCEAWAIRQAVEHLNQSLERIQSPLTVLAGADVRLDERIPRLLEADEILTVGDTGRYLLLELPHEVFIDPFVLLTRLGDMGVTAVITHPERHGFLAQKPDYVKRWLEYSPCLQITAGSLAGAFGRPSEGTAWALIHAPLPVLVATDAHDITARAPRMTEAYQRLSQRLGQSVADVLCVENPQRLIRGQDMVMLNGTLPRERKRWADK